MFATLKCFTYNLITKKCFVKKVFLSIIFDLRNNSYFSSIICFKKLDFDLRALKWFCSVAKFLSNIFQKKFKLILIILKSLVFIKINWYL